jgi:DNA-binding transcriptional MerR regulator
VKTEVPVDVDENSPLFAIAIAAELSGMHPQTLRQYDRLGMVSPRRTAGQSRRYTMRDVVQLREIARLSAEGLNLEGIRRILELENQVAALSSPLSPTNCSTGQGDASSRPAPKATSCPCEPVSAPRKPTSLWSGDRSGPGPRTRM